jgi:hypothetical protein
MYNCIYIEARKVILHHGVDQGRQDQRFSLHSRRRTERMRKVMKKEYSTYSASQE